MIAESRAADVVEVVERLMGEVLPEWQRDVLRYLFAGAEAVPFVPRPDLAGRLRDRAAARSVGSSGVADAVTRSLMREAADALDVPEVAPLEPSGPAP